MRLLFVTSTRIGDAIISTTVLNHVLDMYPEARVTLACGPLPAPLFEDLPNLEKLITVTKKKLALHWVNLWWETVSQPWDLAIDLRGSVLPYCLFAQRRLRWSSNPSPQTRHEQLLDLMGVQKRILPKVWISPQRLRKVQGAMPKETPIIAIAPAANWLGKEWPAENYVELVHQLIAPRGYFPRAKVAIFAAPHEYERLGYLRQQLQDHLIDVSSYPHLLDVASLLKSCALFVGNDSGLMHLAAAVGIPTLGLFGPSDDRLYRPTGPQCDFIRTPESFEHLWRLVKAGQTKSLMSSLTVNMVLEKVSMLVSRNKPPAPAVGKNLLSSVKYTHYN